MWTEQRIVTFHFVPHGNRLSWGWIFWRFNVSHQNCVFIYFLTVRFFQYKSIAFPAKTVLRTDQLEVLAIGQNSLRLNWIVTGAIYLQACDFVRCVVGGNWCNFQWCAIRPVMAQLIGFYCAIVVINARTTSWFIVPSFKWFGDLRVWYVQDPLYRISCVPFWWLRRKCCLKIQKWNKIWRI